jgi:hypothetical protein
MGVSHDYFSQQNAYQYKIKTIKNSSTINKYDDSPHHKVINTNRPQAETTYCNYINTTQLT